MFSNTFSIFFLTLGVIVSVSLPLTQGSSILFYFGSSTYSHKVSVWPLVTKLAAKGHKVTFLSPPLGHGDLDLPPPPGVTLFIPKALSLYTQERNSSRDLISSRVKGFSDGQGYWDGALQSALEICRLVFRSSEVQDFFFSSGENQFDLVVISTPYNECALGLAFKLNVPFILFGSTPSLYMWHQETFGLPDETSWLPNYYYHFPTGYGIGLSIGLAKVSVEAFSAVALETAGLPKVFYSLTVGGLVYGRFTASGAKRQLQARHAMIKMSFLQRVRNALAPLQWFYSTNRVSYILPQMELLMQKAMNLSDPDLPPFTALEKLTSVFLLNTYFTQEYPRSLPPFVVPVGGMHLLQDSKDPDPSVSPDLPSDLQDFMDKFVKDEGFIYVSFGSQVEFSRAPTEVIEKFLNTFIYLELPILWRWDDPSKAPKERPKRIFISSWFPQEALLAHPKLRVFITNGGTLSHQEAIFHAVPLIAFPLSPEEDYNAGLIEKSGMGIKMDIAWFTQYEFASNVRKLISHTMYRKTAQKLSVLFKDCPLPPDDTALWWTEYVLRHKNLTFLKPQSIHQSWYERRSLDVWAFIVLASLGTLLVMGKVINYVLCSKNGKTPAAKKPKHKVA